MSEKRIHIKKKLRQAFGDRCYWCAGVMRKPNYGENDPSASSDPDVETIEHHLQKEKGTNLFMHLRLSHRRCNI